jgi:2,4-didehydro-3-deoxy-L-rhamnonate hydrolase
MRTIVPIVFCNRLAGAARRATEDMAMAVHVLAYEEAGALAWGVLRGEEVIPIPGSFPTTADLIRGVDVAALRGLRGAARPLASLALRSPVTANQQFVCQGANYRQHMIESGVDPDAKTFNMIFTKATSCIVPSNHHVVRPTGVRFLDYEVELGLVLRRDLKGPCRLSDDDLPGIIAGLVIVNDYSARDVQLPQMQFYKGKSFRTFGPVGPHLCLLEAPDFALLRRLTLELRVNGEVRQRDSTANMVYGPAETISEMSTVHDLYTGDLISTGTPAGCALAVPSPLRQRLGSLLPERTKWRVFERIQDRRAERYLKPGDVVETWIRSDDGTIDLGLQRNLVVDEVSLPRLAATSAL